MFDLIQQFETITSLPDDAKLYILRFLECKRLKKNEFIITAGQICKHIYFVKDGLIRGFFTHFGQDHTVRFVQKGQACIVPGSFPDRMPSKESVQAVCESEVYALTWDHIQRTCRMFPTFHRVLDHYNLQINKEITDRICALLSLNGIRRYRWIKEQYPLLVEQVPVSKLASYIGLSSRAFFRFLKVEKNKSNQLI